MSPFESNATLISIPSSTNGADIYSIGCKK
jgi:hypothetical protein